MDSGDESVDGMAVAAPTECKKVNSIECAVEMAIIEARSQVLLERLAKRQKNMPKTITEQYDDDKTVIERCLESSEAALASLIRDGKEIITNVRIANDKREVDRRVKEAELRDNLLEKLEQESVAATEKFDAITQKWEQLEDVKDPVGIFEGLTRQKARIAELMHQKDSIIRECRDELAAADERYNLSLAKQEMDLECLSDRIDSQLDIMKRAYREHLELLETTIASERNTLRLAFNQKWESMFEKRGINEDMKMRKEKELAEFYAAELQRITLEHEEITKTTRIRLDVDNQNLELELQKVKAEVLLNSAKLDYNWQVLKQREQENVAVKSHQKRRLAKLNDTIAELKNKIKRAKVEGKRESDRMSGEIMRLHANIFDLVKKKDLLNEMNDKKFQAVWQTNFDEASTMLQQVLDIDRILHEQQLGLEWRAPDVKLLQRKELPSYKAAMELLKDAPKREATPNLFDAAKEERNKQTRDKKFLKHILYTIADKAEFLVENQLLDLIEPYSEEQKTLVRLDSVFQVLGVQNSDDIDALQEFFLPYAVCKLCENNSSNDSECGHVHELLVEPTSVLKALRDFTKGRLPEQKPIESTYGELVGNRLATASKPTLSRMLSSDDVEMFWSRFNEIFTPQHEKLWTAMEHGLTQYLDVLKQREKLDNECEFLRQQNVELNHLLEKYVAGPATPQPNNQFGYFN